MKLVSVRSLVLVALPLALASGALGERLPGEYYNEFHLGYETPHTSWAKPLAGGKVRAFFIAPTHAAREVTELAERLDMQVGGETAIYSYSLGDESHYVGMIKGTSNEEKKYAILRKLQQPYDVYVLANFPVSKLPIQLQFEILKRVKEGAGLLLTYRREAPEQMWRHPLGDLAEIVREVPIAGLTFYRNTFLEKKGLPGFGEVPDALVSGFRIGEGRVALVDYAVESKVRIAGGFCLTPAEHFTYRTLTEYDYHQSLVAKALLWAAKREPAVRFTELPLEGIALSSGAQTNAVSVALHNTLGQPLRGSLEVSVRNEWGEKEHTDSLTQTLQPGDNAVELTLRQLPGGTHFLDMRFVSKRGVEGWGSAALLMSSPTEISEVEMAKLSFEREEPCEGVVRFSQPIEGAGWALRVTLLDNYQRRFCQQDLPLDAGAEEKGFSLPLEGSVSLAGRARIALLRDGITLDQIEQEFFVAQRNDDYFPALVWGNLPGIFGHFTGVQLHKAGFNSILHYYGEGVGEGRRPSTIAREDFHAIPYVTRLGPTAWEGGRLGDIAADTKATEALQERARMSKPFDPLVYSLGDENRIPSIAGFDPKERPAFITFLKGRYADLGALNAAWGTELKSFEEAEPIKAGEAATTKQFVRFHDTEAFREYLYANWHHYCHDVIKAVDPHGRIGAEGSVPGEMELTIQGLEFWGPYRRTDQNTLLRSLAPRSLVRGNWFGGYNSGRRDLPGLPRFLWESVLDGSTLLEVYCSYTCENFYNTDLTWAYWMDSFLPDLKEITEGLGQLLMRSEHDCDPIAVYQSQPSVHFEKLSGPFGRYEIAHRAALRMLEDLSFVPYYVTSRQVEEGALAEKRPRILILPHAVALSDAEVAEIERFVREGGVLIADVRPGIADGSCKLREMGALDDLFGVSRKTGEGEAARADVSVGGSWESAALKLNLDATTIEALDVDASVTATEGTALAESDAAPVCIVHEFGKGAAVLLNFSLDAYGSKPRGVGPPPLYEVARGLAYGTGLRPAWQMLAVGLESPTYEDHETLAGGRVSAFARGKARVCGFLPPRPEDVNRAVPATIIAPESAHLYDLRAGKYLGHKQRTKTALKFTSATLISALRYRVTRLDLRAPARLQAGEACRLRVRLRAEGDTAGAMPIFRINVIGPEGEDRHYYARTLCPEGLEASTVIPFALSDTPGEWRILARDVLTGTTATATVRLEGAK